MTPKALSRKDIGHGVERTQENWKEEFNTLFGYASKVEIEYFISALLAEERNKVLSEVEREVEMNYDIDFNMQDEPFRENNSYNQALDDILKIINNLKMSLAFHKAFPNGVNLNTMTNDLKNFLEGDFIGNNVHSVYTHCLSCGAWGINLPSEKMCGNCTKDTDTYTYYDKETIALHDTRLINFVLDLVEKEVEKKENELWEKHELHVHGECDFESINISTIINQLKV